MTERRAETRAGSALLVRPEVASSDVARAVRHVRKEVVRGLVPDFLCGPTTCVVLVTLRNHLLNPNGVYDRLKLLRSRPAYRLRILLIVADGSEGRNTHELQKLALLAGFTAVISASVREAARYLETLRALDGTNTEAIARLADVDPLTTVRGVTRNDAEALCFNIGSFRDISLASEAQLRRIPGMGDVKVMRLHNALHQPFLAQSNAKSDVAVEPDPETHDVAEDFAG